MVTEAVRAAVAGAPPPPAIFTDPQQAQKARSRGAPPLAEYRGQTIYSQFVVEELRGVGSTGTVFRATQLGIGRPVALKVLHPDLKGQPEIVERFRREAQIASRLSHPNIVHLYLTGLLPDGRTYGANDPDLLTWVHVTEMWSFVRGYQLYRGIELPRAIRDRYFAETRRIAEALGARGVPGSQAEVEHYFEQVRPRLEFSKRSATVIEVLENIRLPGPMLRPARALFLGSGAALLPEWALQLMKRSRRRRALDQAARLQLRAISPLLRSGLRDGVASRAVRRVGHELSLLQAWPEVHEPSTLAALMKAPRA